MRRSLIWLSAAVVLLGGAAVLAWHFSRTPVADGQPTPAPPAELRPTPGLPWFEDVTAASGIAFQHFDSATPHHYIHETMGSGLAWIDYDNDGWPDLFCIQDEAVRPGAGDRVRTCKLYRNNGDGTFRDVTEAVGLTRTGFGMGAAVGDFDNDGYDDLVVTYLGGIVLYHNEPDGKGGRRFKDVTADAGLHNPHWATSCAWGDVDGDGLLDLYVCNYVEVDLAKHPRCEHPGTHLPMSCSPTAFPNVTHKLFHNEGGGKFTDVSQSSGIAAVPPAPGLGVVMTDLDGDGLLDIYVANDLKPAYLFHNQGKGKFVEKALLQGAALGPNGSPIAGMGVSAADVDGSGRPSLFVSNFQNEPNVLFLNKGRLFFQDTSYPSGLGLPSLDRLGFGAVFLDADLDGRLDIACANGHIQRHARKLLGVAFAQEAQLFLGEGKGRFREVSAQAGAYFHKPMVGRGLAWADYDNDGKPDLAFSNNGGPAVLLHNATATDNRWIRLELIGDGKKSNRNAIGAKVELEAGGVKQTHFLNGGGSYLSASDRRLLVGLGKADRVDHVTVFWPSGSRQTFAGLEARRWWRLHEGRAQAERIDIGPARAGMRSPLVRPPDPP